MRIAIILHDPGPGGTERVALTLGEAWQRLGIEVRLFLGSGMPHPSLETWVAAPPIARSAFSRVAVARAMLRPVADWKPDILFLPGNWHFLMARWLAAVRPRPLIVGKLSNPPVPDGPARPVAEMLFRAFTAPIDAIAAWPEVAARDVERLTPGKHVARVPNPPLALALQRRDHARKATGRVLVAGRLVPQKDVGLALATFREIVALRPGLSLDIAGDGPERMALEAGASGLPVRFHGHVRDLAPLLGQADALLLTSRFEGTPAVVIEALAAGVPVVATDCSPFVREVLDGPGRGRLVEARKAPALARTLLQILDAPGPMPGIEDVLAPYEIGAIAARYLALFKALRSGAG
jgi:glycosyltransferase involved in cell wall biosynthesis